MKHTAKKQPKPIGRIITIAIVIVMVLGGSCALVYKQLHNKKSDGPSAAEKQQEKDQADQKKQETADRSSSKGDDDSTDTSTTQDIAAFINRSSQVATNGTVNISVRATIQGADSGTCELTFTKIGQSDLIKMFPIQFEATSATCGSADIPVSEFPVSGEWQLKLVAKNNGNESSPVTSKVNVQK